MHLFFLTTIEILEAEVQQSNTTEFTQFLKAFFEPFGLSKINVLTDASNSRQLQLSIKMLDLQRSLKFIRLRADPSDVEFVPKYETFEPTSKIGVVVLSNSSQIFETLSFVSAIPYW